VLSILSRAALVALASFIGILLCTLRAVAETALFQSDDNAAKDQNRVPAFCRANLVFVSWTTSDALRRHRILQNGAKYEEVSCDVSRPASVIAEWKKTDPDTRKAAEEKMRAEWKNWMNDHANIFADIGAGVGKTKVVTAQRIYDS
jgi:hypothetical protein